MTEKAAEEARLASQKAAEEARLASQLAQQRQAAQAKQAAIAARSTAFVKTNGVTRLVTAEQLAANPFVYQGQVVALYGVFEQMTSATQARFSAPGVQAFQVSGIPAGRFVRARVMVMLAGRVTGNVEVKVPILGPTLVPSLSFVGSAFCQVQNCADYSINVK